MQHIKTLLKQHGRLALALLQPPDLIAQEIVDDLEAALERLKLIAGDLVPETIAD